MLIEEYVKEAAPMAGARVLVEMKSTQSDMTGVGFFTVRNVREEDLSDRLFPDTDGPGDSNNEYGLVSEGLICMRGNRLELSYEETAIEGIEGCTTVISFDVDDPECVTVERIGALSSAFVIAKKKRLFSTYATPYGTLDMCIYAKKVENTLTEEGGTLILDYAVELKGLTAQRTRMEVKVKELK